MPVLTHRSSCRTSTSPIQCWDCGTSVFFLTCTCGSKVVFKELGGDWNKHDCRLPVKKETGSLRILLKAYDPRILELAVMRIADIAKSTGAGMRIPPLLTSKRPKPMTSENPQGEYEIKLINPSVETMRALARLNLPSTADFRVARSLTPGDLLTADRAEMDLFQRAKIAKAKLEQKFRNLQR